MLGHASVASAQRAITSREFAEWRAYDRLSPIGAERMDWLIAMLASVVANTAGKKGKPFEAKDFVPKWGPPERKSAAALQQMFEQWATIHNEVEAQRHGITR